MDKVVIIGAGGHAKVIASIILKSKEYLIEGYISKDKQGTNILGAKVLGDDSILPHLIENGLKTVVIAIGDNSLREKIYNNLMQYNLNYPNIISQDAVIDETVKMGVGNVVMPGAVVNVDTTIESFSIFNTNSSVDHDCKISSFSHLAPNTVLTGGVQIHKGVFVGAGATIIPNTTVYEKICVGAGAVVTKDLQAEGTYVGIPAKIINKSKLI